MQTTYENFGYILKSINNIIKFININTSHDKYYSRIEKLYISRFDNIRGKILPKNKGKIIGYPFEWLSLINIIEDSKNDYVKGWYNNKPFIKEIKKNGLKKLDISGFLYEVDKNTFAYLKMEKKKVCFSNTYKTNK